jgi:site-specific recombinase XerD
MTLHAGGTLLGHKSVNTSKKYAHLNTGALADQQREILNGPRL